MLYLAEVQKQKTGFMGASKAELKLLACQRADQSWTPVPGEEVIPSEEANNLHTGALVIADLNANRQVQRIQEAGRPLVSILQTFSRQLEKSKSQEEEIEQWKQSLTYQSQELNRRNMEMEARLEQLQQTEDDFKQLEAQRQEIVGGREAVKRLQTEIERSRRELEKAWEHLQGEQRRLREQPTNSQPTVLDENTAIHFQELLERLSNGVAPTEAVREQLNLSFEMCANQQSILDHHWQQLQQQRLTAQQQQEEVDRAAEAVQISNQQWQQSQNSLEQASSDLKVQISLLNSKQEYAQILSQKLRKQQELYQQIYRLAEPSEKDNISQVDLEALENMPLDQLQQLVQDLQRDLQKNSQFVNDQEEELNLQQQTIDELSARLSQANDNDRMNIEIELAEEQDSYNLLNQTLVGQRQSLRERKYIINEHQAVLWRRQGIDTEDKQEDDKIDLQPIIVQIEAQRQQQLDELQKLEQQILQISDGIQQAQGMIEHQADEHGMKRQELQSLEQNLLSLRAAAAESWARVNLYQEILQPVQDSLDGLRHHLQPLKEALLQLEATTNNQIQVIAQMRQTLLSII